MKKVYCIDCGKLLNKHATYYGTIRCRSCCIKYLFKIGKLNQSGKNHSQFKKGLPKCIDCGKQLYNYSAKRCHSCCQKGILHPDLSGDKNGMFGKHHTKEAKRKSSLSHGGTGIPYENEKYNRFLFNEELKEKIRDRDNYICQNCGMTEEEHIIVYGQVLHIHHVDYNKNNCDKNNLIAVCINCNARANLNRSYWQEIYTNIINKLMGLSVSNHNANVEAGKSEIRAV
jgi:hypothetical protein